MASIDALKTFVFKGFLSDDEALCLYHLAKEACKIGPCLEIGSYCGKSAGYIGTGCKEQGGILYSIDTHRGSAEQQPGQEYFDPDLVDKETGLIDTFKIFRNVITSLSLEDTVVPIVAKSTVVGRTWSTRLGMVFIDGSHTFEDALNDYKNWVFHLLPNGYLVIHDVFPDPSKGGQAPYHIYKLALASGLFVELPMVNTLGILKRTIANQVMK